MSALAQSSNSRPGDDSLEFADEEVLAMVEASTYRDTADALGWSKAKVQRTVERERKRMADAAAEQVERVREEMRAGRKLVSYVEPDAAEADPPGADPTADLPKRVTVKTSIHVLPQWTRVEHDQLFAKAADDAGSPLCVVSEPAFYAAIRKTNAGTGRAFTIDGTPDQPRGYAVLPMFRAAPTAKQAEAEADFRQFAVPWYAEQFETRGWLLRNERQGLLWHWTDAKLPATQQSSGAPMNYVVLRGPEWSPEWLRRKCQNVRWDETQRGRYLGQHAPSTAERRVRLDGWVLQ
jgi:hypothetical protein